MSFWGRLLGGLGELVSQALGRPAEQPGDKQNRGEEHARENSPQPVDDLQGSSDAKERKSRQKDRRAPPAKAQKKRNTVQPPTNCRAPPTPQTSPVRRSASSSAANNAQTNRGRPPTVSGRSASARNRPNSVGNGNNNVQQPPSAPVLAVPVAAAPVNAQPIGVRQSTRTNAGQPANKYSPPPPRERKTKDEVDQQPGASASTTAPTAQPPTPQPPPQVPPQNGPKTPDSSQTPPSRVHPPRSARPVVLPQKPVQPLPAGHTTGASSPIQVPRLLAQPLPSTQHGPLTGGSSMKTRSRQRVDQSQRSLDADSNAQMLQPTDSRGGIVPPMEPDVGDNEALLSPATTSFTIPNQPNNPRITPKKTGRPPKTSASTTGTSNEVQSSSNQTPKKRGERAPEAGSKQNVPRAGSTPPSTSAVTPSRQEPAAQRRSARTRSSHAVAQNRSHAFASNLDNSLLARDELDALADPPEQQASPAVIPVDGLDLDDGLFSDDDHDAPASPDVPAEANEQDLSRSRRDRHAVDRAAASMQAAVHGAGPSALSPGPQIPFTGNDEQESPAMNTRKRARKCDRPATRKPSESSDEDSGRACKKTRQSSSYSPNLLGEETADSAASSDEEQEEVASTSGESEGEQNDTPWGRKALIMKMEETKKMRKEQQDWRERMRNDSQYRDLLKLIRNLARFERRHEMRIFRPDPEVDESLDLLKEVLNGIKNGNPRIWDEKAIEKAGEKWEIDYVISSGEREIGGELPDRLLIKWGGLPIGSWEYKANIKGNVNYYKLRDLRFDSIEVIVRKECAKKGVNFDVEYPNRYSKEAEPTKRNGIWGYAMSERDLYLQQLRAIEHQWNVVNKKYHLPLVYIADWCKTMDNLAESLLKLVYMQTTIMSSDLKSKLRHPSMPHHRHFKCGKDSCVNGCGPPTNKKDKTKVFECCGATNSVSVKLNRLIWIKKQGKEKKAHFRVECTKSCGCDPAKCANRAAQRGRRDVLVVFRDHMKGWTLRCVSEIKKDDVIAEYTGKVRLGTSSGNAQRYDYSMGYEVPWTKKKLVIRAWEKGNETRFMSHSCDPNVYGESTIIERGGLYENRIVFRAIRTTIAGEELCFDYVVDQFMGEEGLTVERMFPDGCFCYSPICRFSPELVAQFNEYMRSHADEDDEEEQNEEVDDDVEEEENNEEEDFLIYIAESKNQRGQKRSLSNRGDEADDESEGTDDGPSDSREGQRRKRTRGMAEEENTTTSESSRTPSQEAADLGDDDSGCSHW